MRANIKMAAYDNSFTQVVWHNLGIKSQRNHGNDNGVKHPTQRPTTQVALHTSKLELA